MVLLLTTLVNQEPMKTLFILLLSSLLFSCFVPRSKSVTPLSYMQSQLSEINDSLYQSEAEPIQIDSLKLETYVLTLFYSCPDVPEDLRLVGSTMLAKSFPPIRSCKLISSSPKTRSHNLKPYKGTVQFDLKPLSHKFIKDAPTYLQIQGWPDKILFIYPE
jgi:hypothetical protein